MAEGEPGLDPAIEAQAVAQLRPNECIHWSLLVPTGDLVVALIDRGLQQVCAQFLERMGHRRLGWGRTLVFAPQSGEWRQVSKGAWGNGVRAMMEYFKIADHEQPGPHWQRGYQFCLDWLKLKGKRPIQVSQAEIDELITRLDGEPDPDLAWPEVRRNFADWCRGRGFAVPDVVYTDPPGSRGGKCRS